MPTLKRNVSKAESRKPIGVYDGPLPPDGTYAGEIRSMKLRTAKTGTQALNTLVVLDSWNKDGQAAEYDGYNTWTKLWLDGSDFSEAREKAAYEAICGKSDVTVQIDDKVKGDPVVTKVGGVNPIGTRVYVELRTEVDPNGQYDPQQNGMFIYPDPKNNGSSAASEESQEDEPEGEEVVAEKPQRAPRKTAAKKATVTNIRKDEPEAEPDGEVDYDSMTLPQARAAAREAGIDTDGVSKRDLITTLKEQHGGGEQGDDPGQLNPKDIQGMDDESLTEWLNDRYEEGDFISKGKLMARKDIIEILVEDKHIRPF